MAAIVPGGPRTAGRLPQTHGRHRPAKPGPFGRHRGTGLAGPLVWPPVRGLKAAAPSLPVQAWTA